MSGVDDLAALIREVDGNHDLGAGALAERLIERGVRCERIAKMVGLIRNEDGSVAQVPWERPPAEAICPKCNEPIRWCLDMFSFTTGFDEAHPFTLTHARCTWTSGGFEALAQIARVEAVLDGWPDGNERASEYAAARGQCKRAIRAALTDAEPTPEGVARGCMSAKLGPWSR